MKTDGDNAVTDATAISWKVSDMVCFPVTSKNHVTLHIHDGWDQYYQLSDWSHFVHLLLLANHWRDSSKNIQKNLILSFISNISFRAIQMANEQKAWEDRNHEDMLFWNVFYSIIPWRKTNKHKQEIYTQFCAFLCTGVLFCIKVAHDKEQPVVQYHFGWRLIHKNIIKVI